MSILDSDLLCHRCSIQQRGNPTTNEDGEPTYIWTTIQTNIPCRFVFGNYNDNPEDNKHQYKWEADPLKPLVYLPPGVTLDRYTTRIVTGDTGVAGTYGIVDIKTRWDEISIDHYEVLLTKVIT